MGLCRKKEFKKEAFSEEEATGNLKTSVLDFLHHRAWRKNNQHATCYALAQRSLITSIFSLPIRWKENDQCCAHREGRGVGSTWYQNTEFPYVCKWFIRGAPAGQHSYYFWMTLIVWFAIYLLPSCLISAALHTVDVSGVVAWRIILSKLFNDAPLQIDNNTRIVLHVLECLWPALVL